MGKYDQKIDIKRTITRIFHKYKDSTQLYILKFRVFRCVCVHPELENKMGNVSKFGAEQSLRIYKKLVIFFLIKIFLVVLSHLIFEF